jgi:DsbC/DsbD-like thiol-disulfide interchange protein
MNAMVPRRVLFAVAAITGLNSASPSARADEASTWVRDLHSSVRLLAGSRSGAVLLGGIEFDLQNGWKTYWRTPGDSGVPPRIDFSRSVNVETVMPLFPAPMKFSDGAGGTSYGYQKHFVLPLRIVPKEPDKPLTLRVMISYAVCERLCLPVDANLELAFVDAVSAKDAELSAALNTVPKPAEIGTTAPLGIRDVTRDGDKVYVDVVKPQSARVELFVEGPTADWSLPEPKPLDHSPAGVSRFAFALEGLPPDTKAAGAALKFTVVSTDGAYEYNINLN